MSTRKILARELLPASWRRDVARTDLRAQDDWIYGTMESIPFNQFEAIVSWIMEIQVNEMC